MPGTYSGVQVAELKNIVASAFNSQNDIVKLFPGLERENVTQSLPVDYIYVALIKV